ncbi:MAG: oxidoreductase [Clostridia bacterium]|nr:oxidoreductase [Clostridia bacterium]
MMDGLRINGVEFGRLYTTTPSLDAKGVDFYDGSEESAADMEAPVVKPEQALIVTEILGLSRGRGC